MIDGVKEVAPSLSRRCLFAGALAGALAQSHHAKAETGIDDLDDAAIAIANPKGVFLASAALTGTRIFVSGEHGVILYSDDNAASWSQASVPVDVTITAIAFASTKLGWAVGHFGVVLNSSDGGHSWQIQLNGLQANQLTLEAAQDLDVASSPSPGAPLALKRAEFFVASGPSKPFFAILVLSPLKVLVFGAYRMTMITYDGGKSWADASMRIYDRTSQNLYASAKFGNDIFVVGESGIVFRSIDEGESFPPVGSPSSVTLLGIVHAHDSSLVVFGVAGNCYRTIDRGNTWVESNMPTQDNLTSGCVLASGKILVGSQSGVLFASADNGMTFGPVTGVPPTAINDFVETTSQRLVFAGNSGPVAVPLSALAV